jgi:hypothetical protein
MRFDSGTFTVRLWGTDAPESSQPYGRLIGEVEVLGESRFFAGRALALAGLAWADRKNAPTGRPTRLVSGAKENVMHVCVSLYRGPRNPSPASVLATSS